VETNVTSRCNISDRSWNTRGCEAWCVSVGEERRLRVLRKIICTPHQIFIRINILIRG
jgi:hypothetical protein